MPLSIINCCFNKQQLIKSKFFKLKETLISFFSISPHLKSFSAPSEPGDWLIRNKIWPVNVIWGCHDLMIQTCKVAISTRARSSLLFGCLTVGFIHRCIGSVCPGSRWSSVDPDLTPHRRGRVSPADVQNDDKAVVFGGDLQQPWCGIMPRLQGWRDLAAVDSRDEWRVGQKPAFSTVWTMSRKGIFHFTNLGCTSNALEAAVEKNEPCCFWGIWLQMHPRCYQTAKSFWWMREDR